MPRFPFSNRCRAFVASVLLSPFYLAAAPTHLVDEAVQQISEVAPGVYLVDFGRVAFANVRLIPPIGAKGAVTVHFGESLDAGRIDRTPPGTVRYGMTTVDLGSSSSIVAAPPADVRNTWDPNTTDFRHEAMRMLASPPPPAILTPAEWGVVLPYRWLEIEGWPGELHPEHLTRQSIFASTWDDTAADFRSSDPTLNRIWELCRYSIKATTFAGIYVDGDRERIPYEADAYLNQLSHYATDNDVQMARDTLDHLMIHGTWPTEWAPHLVLMAHADWMRTGDTSWLQARFEELKTKLLTHRAGPDGLIRSDEKQRGKNDIVDWPKGERDGYVFTEINTVINALHLHTLRLMSEMAAALGKPAEARHYAQLRESTLKEFQARLFDSSRGIYVDGIGTDHASQHANLFPLAFGLVPEGAQESVTKFVISRGMACSVYAAQYLMEGLFAHEAGAAALDLILAPGDRSWRHMVESGTTISWEAWDLKYKPNQDWNHAWGAAPANILPRFVLGVEPTEAGWHTIRVRPSTGSLTQASGKIPSPHGPLFVAWTHTDSFKLNLTLPSGISAQLELPATADSTEVLLNGQPVAAVRDGLRWIVTAPLTQSATIEVR